MLTGIIQAAGLGKLTVASYLGQPFKAEIALESVKNQEISSLSARLAPSEAFQQAGVSLTPYHSTLSVSIEKRTDGQPYIQISSPQPISEPFLNLLIELSWSSGRLLRDYTVLLDPAETPGGVAAAATGQSEGNNDSASVHKSTQSVSETVKNLPVGQVESADSGGEVYGPVSRGDTLTRIARQVSPENIDLNQVLVALYRANRDAFLEKNMNLLKVGAILRIPDLSEISLISSREAVHEIAVQKESWNSYRQRIADMATGIPGGEGLKQSQTGKITAVPDKSSAAAARPEEVLILSKGELLEEGQSMTENAEGNVAQHYLRMMEEDAIAKERALQEANERVTILEQNIAKLQRLLELKGSAPERVDQPESDQMQSDSALQPVPATEPAGMAPETSAPAIPAPGGSMPPEFTIPAQSIAAGLPANPLQSSDSSADEFSPVDTLVELAKENIEWAGGALAVLLAIGLGVSVARRRRGRTDNFDEANDIYGYPEKESGLTSIPNTVGIADDLVNPKSTDTEFDQQTATRTEVEDLGKADDNAVGSRGFFFGGKSDEDSSESGYVDTDSVDQIPESESIVFEKIDVSDQEIQAKTTEIGPAQAISEEKTSIEIRTDAPDSKEGGNELWNFSIDNSASDSGSDPVQEEGSIKEGTPSREDHEFDLNLPDDSDSFQRFRSEGGMTDISSSLANIDLELRDESQAPSGAESEHVDEAVERQRQEVATKLDLARAYLEMDDKEGAREILEEVLREGDQEQQSEARSILDEIK